MMIINDANTDENIRTFDEYCRWVGNTDTVVNNFILHKNNPKRKKIRISCCDATTRKMKIKDRLRKKLTNQES